MTATPTKQAAQDTSYHDRRLAKRLAEDPEFAAEFARQQREIAVIDRIVNRLDDLRASAGLTKSGLARAIGKNPASIRRLLTAPVNPELRTVVAIANALGAEVQIVGRSKSTRSGSAARSTAKRSTASRSTAKRSTAARSTAKRSTAARSTAKRSTAARSMRSGAAQRSRSAARSKAAK